MTPREFLDLEVSLILLKHGKEALLQAVARRMQLSDEALRLELDTLLRAKITSSSKKKITTKPFILDSILVGREGKADYLHQLCARFENRTFLSELKDVRRFFDRHGRSIPTWKSRVLAQASLFRLLADLDISELKKLLDEEPAGAEVSSLGLISDEILGRNKLGQK
ncbi:MAG: hypothetical protein GJU77_08410 [Ferrovum sp.]|jgi:hypothetical protein|nr:hypothetical protein [Ferrovum sp.]NDU89857.1 hypothetical protein [Ferrovum sp.]